MALVPVVARMRFYCSKKVNEKEPTHTIPLNEVQASLYEVRKKIHPRSVKGIFSSWRIVLVLFTQLIFYGLPWLTWNDRQAFLLDINARKFYIFNQVLWPQDIIFLSLLLIISAYALFLFTAIAGRLFCGYACPQTVYTEVFLWVEKFFEGDRVARLRLEGEPWSWRKIRIKAGKHAVWILIALWTGFTFVGYFTPIRNQLQEILSLTLGPWQLFWMLFYSFATWGNAGFMREQVCKYMCPYARFQSVMVDKNTLVVTYDKTIGEPRGSRSKAADYKDAGLGTCVDCSICVQVCPTGIDIRDGLQYECIGCGACIDACNQVMDKMHYPRGLVRYTSENAMLQNWSAQELKRHIFRPRILIYSAILLVLVAIFFAKLATRDILRVDVIRDRGVMARMAGDGEIENIYQLQIMNASDLSMRISVQASGLQTLRAIDAEEHDQYIVDVPAEANRMVPLKLRAEREGIEPGSHKVMLTISQIDSEGRHIKELAQEATRFFIPDSRHGRSKEKNADH